MKARFIHEIGTRAWLRVYWGEDCPNCLGRGSRGYHNAQVHFADSEKNDDLEPGGEVADHPDERWPKACDHCGTPVPADLPVSPPARDWDDEGNQLAVVRRQVFRKRLYDTASGDPEPGDLFHARWFHEGPHAGGCEWSNCSGPHLRAVLPNGASWDVDGRASNCTLKTDKTHRCWVRHGDPSKGEPVHVDKAGRTCAAGAGSIIGGNWHGFLHNGVWRSC